MEIASSHDLGRLDAPEPLREIRDIPRVLDSPIRLDLAAHSVLPVSSTASWRSRGRIPSPPRDAPGAPPLSPGPGPHGPLPASLAAPEVRLRVFIGSHVLLEVSESRVPLYDDRTSSKV